jgi:hypothetical protein
VVGACANVFGEGLTPSYIPSFSWGQDGTVRYDFEKALRDITNWKQLKSKTLTEKEIQSLEQIFNAK